MKSPPGPRIAGPRLASGPARGVRCGLRVGRPPRAVRVAVVAEQELLAGRRRGDAAPSRAGATPVARRAGPVAAGENRAAPRRLGTAAVVRMRAARARLTPARTVEARGRAEAAPLESRGYPPVAGAAS